MNKKFCDLCEKPAWKKEQKEHVHQELKVYCDPKAKVRTAFYVGFVHHSTGYGGPADICKDCLKGLMLAHIDKVFGEDSELKMNGKTEENLNTKIIIAYGYGKESLHGQQYDVFIKCTFLDTPSDIHITKTKLLLLIPKPSEKIMQEFKSEIEKKGVWISDYIWSEDV